MHTPTSYTHNPRQRNFKIVFKLKNLKKIKKKTKTKKFQDCFFNKFKENNFKKIKLNFD
jgi:hypothetical protein